MGPSDTQMRILRSLREGPRQSQDIAAEFGADMSSVYRHLETLRAEGLVAAEKIVDGPGRPKKVFRLTPHGQEAFPRDYAFLLSAVLDQLEKQGGRAAVLANLDGIAAHLAGPLAGNGDPSQRLDKLVGLYNRLGFEASIERQGSQLAIVQRNCPFLRTARDDPAALCECLDEGLMKAAIPEARIELQSTLAKGDDRCRHTIRLLPGKAKGKRG